MRIATLLLLICIIVTPSIYAQDTEEETEEIGIPPINGEEIPEISEEELLEIISRGDNFFVDQGIENLAVDIILYRDPLKKITIEHMRNGTVGDVISLTPVFAHYFWEAPGSYEMRIMGQTLISTDADSVQSYTSLLPLPGGQVLIPEVKDNYNFEYLGYDEVHHRQTHKVRISAKEYDEQFIKYTIYDFDVEEGYLTRIESHFDDGYYRGHGAGEFYYTERGGKLLPAYGGGQIFLAPIFHITIWGNWFKWDFNSEDFTSLKKDRGSDDEIFVIDPLQT